MTLVLQIVELQILYFRTSVELEIGAINVSFKVISWYEVTLLLSVESIVL